MTDFMYSRVPAFNPNTSPVSLARSASGSVYDIGDTGFTTPLNMTMVATGAVTTTLLSDANGMFPDFTLVDRTSAVFKSGAQKFVLTTTTPVPGPKGDPGPASTVPGPPTTDASLLAAGTLADARLPARLQDAALSATYGPTAAGMKVAFAGVGSGNIQATARRLADAYGDVTFQLLGDSTIAIWYPGLLDQIKAMYPHRSIRVYTWDDTAKAYAAPVTYFTGSGTTWVNVYDGSKGGTIWEFAYLNANAKFGVIQPDLAVIGYGLNQGNTATATARAFYRQEWQRLTAVVKGQAPAADVLLVSQNPRIDAGYQVDLATNRAQAVRSVAAEMGAAYGPVTEAYLAAGPAAYLNADGIHPNAAGTNLYGSTLAPLFSVQPNMQPGARILSPLLTTGSEIGINGDFASFPGELTGWTRVNCDIAKDSVNYESPNGYAVKITANAAAQSRMEQMLPVNRVKGRWITVAARMWIPAGQSNVTGRIEITSTGGTAPVAVMSPGTQVTTRDCWTWEYTSAYIPADAATVKVKLIAGATTEATAQVTVDRVFIGIGTQPHDVVSRTALPQAAPPPSQDGLTAGQIVPNRDLMSSATVSHATGTMALAFFTADKTETISTLTAYTGTTAAAATPTLCRMGIYEIDASGNGTLVGSTPNDTALFAATNTGYAKAVSTPFVKTLGKRYATAILVTSAVGLPTFHGPLSVATPPASSVAFLAPVTIGRMTAQTDLPATFTVAQVIAYQSRSHMLLS